MNLHVFCDPKLFPKNLHVFCNPKGAPAGRFHIADPWICAGYWYATDGYIAVRVPTDAGRTLPVDKEDELHHPDAPGLFAKFPKCNFPWPVYEHELLACRECARTGRTNRPKTESSKCIFCGGGKGSVIAPKGEVWKTDQSRRKIQIGDSWFDVWYLAMIESQFRGLRFAKRKSYDVKPLAFTADGCVQGLLMALPSDQKGNLEWPLT